MELNRLIPVWVLPVMVLAMLVEALYWTVSKRRNYHWQESLTSLIVAMGFKISGIATTGLIAGLFGMVWNYRLFTVPYTTWWGASLLFIGLEFFYYWQHRMMHTCRWFWASHAVHHTTQHFNLSCAYRLGWTSAISGAALFYLPLIWLGFAPKIIVTGLAINLFYQFWLHTELVPKLVWLEKIFNTPSSHRAHHACNPRYLDSNFGGITILFDRLYGTYVAENPNDPCRYGLVQKLNSNHTLSIVFYEWGSLWQDLRHSKNLHEALAYVFGPPGWSSDGSRQTSRELKRATLHATKLN